MNFEEEKQVFYLKLFKHFPKPTVENQIMELPNKNLQNNDQEPVNKRINFCENKLRPNYQFFIDNQFCLKQIYYDMIFQNWSILFGILGSVFFLLIGLLPSNMNVYAGVFSMLAGGLLSAYIGYHVKSNVIKNKIKTEFDLYIFQQQYVITWMQLQQKNYESDKENLRFVLERGMNQIKMIQFHSYLNKKQIKKAYKSVKQLNKLLLQKQCQEALILSLDILKYFIKKNLEKKYVNFKIQSIILPVVHTLTKCQSRNFQNSTLYRQIYKFLHKDKIFLQVKQIQDLEYSSHKQMIILKLIKHLNDPISDTLELIQRIQAKQDLILQQNQNKIEKQSKKPLKENIQDLSDINIQIQSNQLLHKQQSQQIQENNHLSVEVESVSLNSFFVQYPEQSDQNQNDEIYDLDTLQQFDQLVEYQQSQKFDWTIVLDKKECSIYKSQSPNNPCVLLKAQARLFNTSIDILVQLILDIKLRQKWDSIICDFQVIETINEYIDIIKFYVKSPSSLLVAHRSFIQQRTVRQDFPEKDNLTILFRSIEYPNYPLEKGNFVRAHTFISGYIFKKNGDNVDLFIVNQVDVKGFIPPFIVNTVAQKAPIEWVQKLQKASDDYKQNKIK